MSWIVFVFVLAVLAGLFFVQRLAGRVHSAQATLTLNLKATQKHNSVE
jgi:hypothetical protein